MYAADVDGETLTFGNTSALLDADMVMFDHQTGSYWYQVSGAAIVGELTGKQLELLPSITTDWQTWVAEYPNSFVLSQDTGYNRNYRTDQFSGLGARINRSGIPFLVNDNANDVRLRPGDIVVAIEVDGNQRGYPVENIGTAVVNETVATTSVVVFSNAENFTATVYSPIVDGQALTFTYKDGAYRDIQTNSTWSLSGIAIDGELTGMQLDAFPSRSAFWFSIAATYPDVTLYGVDE